MGPGTEPQDGLAFTITGRDIWDKLDSIQKEVSGMPKTVEDHEHRIRALEKKVWMAAAAGAALGTGGGWLQQLLGG